MAEKPTRGGRPAALDFALQAQAGQLYGNWPHTVHLMQVAETVRELGFTAPELQTIAYLHDILEDTAVTPQEIEARFGAMVRTVVEQLTGTGKLVSEYVKQMGEHALAVALAERVSDLREMDNSHMEISEQERRLARYEHDLPALVRRCETMPPAFQQASRVAESELEPAAERLRARRVAPAPTIELPIYCIIGIRPVRAVETRDGGMDVQVFDWSTGAFVRDMSYLSRVVFPEWGTDEIEFLSREEFDRYTRELRHQKGLV